jgi:hypothetical protein
VNVPRGSRYHSPRYVIRSIACSTLKTSHGLNPGMILANWYLPDIRKQDINLTTSSRHAILFQMNTRDKEEQN